ncbi:MAG: 16S rRNA (cytidine(1402)-2'-O)-methyltransferase [Parerythrobacter sp.]
MSDDRTLSDGLYIVATPIGNLGDITMRAVEVLRNCDVIACEDTRVTGKLLKHLGLSRPMVRYDDHTDAAARDGLIARMQGEAVALVSDAGTPLVSDPGFRLVRAAQVAGIAVTSLPGASAVTVALTLSGMPNDRFLFSGFLPVKEQARRAVLKELGTVRATIIFYETGPRLLRALASVAAVLPGRDIAVARELTKLHEECRRGTVAELAAHYEAHPPKGEIVLLIAPPVDAPHDEADADALLRDALKVVKPSQAAGQVAKATGLDRRMLYARALELRLQ